MRRLAIAAGAALAVLGPASGAMGKELVGATVCGASGCVTRAHPPAALGMTDGFVTPAPAPAPFFTVRLRVDHGGSGGAWTAIWVPRHELVGYRGGDGRLLFDRVGQPIAAAYRAATRGGTPFAARSWRIAMSARPSRS